MNKPLKKIRFKNPKLPKDIGIEFVEMDLFETEIKKIWKKVFPENFNTPHTRGPARERQRQYLRDLYASNEFRIYIVIRNKKDGKPVGWVCGEQQDNMTFYLRNSGVIPSWRRKGLYKAIHNSLVDFLSAIGFERVVSDHHPNNRAMLLFKIARGYTINSVTLDERYGAMVRVFLALQPDVKGKLEKRFQLPHYT